jgi:sugar phosphate isomerase/epimerase
MSSQRLVSLAAGTILDAGPAGSVTVAAAAGWPAVGIWFDPVSWTAATTADVRRRLDDTGLVALDLEPIILGPDGDPGEQVVDVAAELGVQYVLVASRLDDRSVIVDRFAALCDRAAASGVTLVLEFLPIFGVRTLTEAVAIVETAARPNSGVLIDTLHLARSGATAADLDHHDRRLFPYLQLADAPAARPHDLAALVDEARNGRLLLGEGALPIAEVLAAVPEVPVSIELRSAALREAYVDPGDRAVAVLANWRRFELG